MRNDTTTNGAFITSEKVDYLNANVNAFVAEIVEVEKENNQATPQSLFELKAYAAHEVLTLLYYSQLKVYRELLLDLSL